MAEKNNVPEFQQPTIKAVAVNKGRKTVWHIQKMKDEGKKIVQVCPVYHDPMFSLFCEMAGVDIIRYVAPGETCEDRAKNIAWWTRSIRRMAKTINLNAVLQTQQYADKGTALKEASIVLGDGADSVLCMGITNDTLKYLADNNVPVHGHVGVLSGWQTGIEGGYRRVGKTAEDAMRIFRKAYEYQENGMVGMTIEMTPREVTNAIAKKLRVPVIAVAAGGAADGTELVHLDIFGLMPPDKMGRHAKVYANLAEFCFSAYKRFADDVRTGGYPEEKHGWGMDEKELDKFMNTLEQKY